MTQITSLNSAPVIGTSYHIIISTGASTEFVSFATMPEVIEFIKDRQYSNEPQDTKYLIIRGTVLPVASDMSYIVEGHYKHKLNDNQEDLVRGFFSLTYEKEDQDG